LFGRPGDVTLEAAAALWSTANLQAAAYGTRALKSRYIVLRLEDFFGEARQDYALGLAQKLKLDKSQMVARLNTFQAPASLGCWQGRAKELPALTGIFGTALAHFGYIDSSVSGCATPCFQRPVINTVRSIRRNAHPFEPGL
jgi:hypothetical protein